MACLTPPYKCDHTAATPGDHPLFTSHLPCLLQHTEHIQVRSLYLTLSKKLVTCDMPGDRSVCSCCSRGTPADFCKHASVTLQ